MNKKENDSSLQLSLISRWIIAFFSVLFGLIMILWAQDQETWKLIPGVFCFVIAGACILPQPIKGWCGNIVAIVVVGLAIGFFYADHQDPQLDNSPIRFAIVFGLPALAYLANKYGRLLRGNQP